MKFIATFYSYKTNFWPALGILLLLSSCHVYHFEKPQPVDTQNVLSFPRESQGMWQDDSGEMTITITKNSLKMAGFDSEKSFNGTAIQDQGYYGRKDALRSAALNKQTGQFDTVANFIIKNDKIYEIKEGGLGAGYSFTVKGDTLEFKKDLIVGFELGQKALLRKLNDRYYVINVREEILWQFMEGNAVGPWWQMALLEFTADHKIKIRIPGDWVEKNASLIYSAEDVYYFDVEWTKLKLLELRDSLFEDDKKLFHRISKSGESKK